MPFFVAGIRRIYYAENKISGHYLYAHHGGRDGLRSCGVQHSIGLTNEVFVMAFGELVVMGIAGFLLEMFIAGPLAKKLAFRIVTPGEDRMTAVILAVSAMTVCIMCPLMSLIATLLFKGVDSQVIAKWIQTTVMNFPMAFCWQIFFAGPFVRWIFGHLFPEKKECTGNVTV